ncbi:efflux RND transporter permease subunit [Candidatus Nitrospira bockiana]
MRLSEISIRRPVLATVMTLGLVLFGLLAFTRLSVREYPDIERPVVSIRTVYPGASARLVETEVTTILEDSVSGIAGLRAITSISREEVSQITLEFELGHDLDAATNDVRDRTALVRRQLPFEIEEPMVAKSDAGDDEVLWLALFSDRHTELELTDFADRQIRTRLAVLPGISHIYVDGQRRYAMRIWLDPDLLASRRLTVQDVEDALRAQNVAIPSGRIESERREFTVSTEGGLETPEQFNQLIVAYRDGYPVRLNQVGGAALGAEDDRKLVRVNGKPALGLGVMKQSRANALAVARAAKQEISRIQPSLPPGMTLDVAFDSSLSIERSIREVYVAMAIALGLVVLVIFLFLGGARTTVIPAVAIPASIVSTFTLLYLWGFSINLLTLLGLVLAIGLVVDDAIVVLENIHRRIEGGQPPEQAALVGSREIGFAVIATTLALVAVFIPIAFLTGTVGRLFGELALAVAGSVLISGFVALTLTPMMCARMLRRTRPGLLSAKLESGFARLAAGYRRVLHQSFRARSLVLFVGGASLVVSVWLGTRLPSELVPVEDLGWFIGMMTAPEGSTIRYTDEYARQLEALYARIPEIRSIYTVVGRGDRPTVVNLAASWASLVDWDERSRTTQEIVARLTRDMEEMTGVQAFPNMPSPFSASSSKTSLQLVIGGNSYEELERQVGLIIGKAKGLESLTNLDTDLDLNKPELEVKVQRNKAADLGVSLAGLGRTLETLLGGRPVTRFIRDGRAYPVIVKVRDRDRVKPSDIQALYVRGRDGQPVPLSNLVTIRETVAPKSLNHYDKMRAVTISASVAPGYTLGQALEGLEATAREIVPPGTRISYAGETKEFKEATGGLVFVFVLALVVIYLVLAAQFESFVHPLTILLSVPPAVTGALLALKLLGGTLNIYTQIGLVMLIGLVAKNAILIVEFANQLRQRGSDPTTAILDAATLRLRPVLMTSLATVLGAVPLALATGAGAVSRQQLGIVVIGGLLFSTLLTLFLVPAVYLLLSRERVTHQAARVADDERNLPEPVSPVMES